MNGQNNACNNWPYTGINNQPYMNYPNGYPSHVTHSWSTGMAEQMYLPRLLAVLERIAAAMEAANVKNADTA